MKELLYQKLSNEFGLTRDEFSTFEEFIKTKKYSKGDFILKQGEIDTQIKLLLSGIVHQYVIIEDEFHTIGLTLSNMYFNSHKSYVEGSPSIEIQEAIIICLLSINQRFSLVFTNDWNWLNKNNEKVKQLNEKNHQYNNQKSKWTKYINTSVYTIINIFYL